MRDYFRKIKINSIFSAKAFDLLNENLKMHHSIYLSFPQYVSLVQEFIEFYVTNYKNIKHPAIFTGLCITPLQWFNYIIKPVSKNIFDIDSLSDINSFWADAHWINYHDFLVKLRCNNFSSCKKPISNCIEHALSPPKCPDYSQNMRISFYRHLLSVADSVQLIEKYNFPRAAIFEKQLNDMYVVPQMNSLIYSANDLSSNALYSNMPSSERAYLIVDSTYAGNKIQLGEAISNYYQFSDNCNVEYYNDKFSLKKVITNNIYRDIILNDLPEDFILFGYMDNNRFVSYYALGCDVSEDKVKLKLFLIDNNKLKVLDNIVNGHFLS